MNGVLGHLCPLGLTKEHVYKGQCETDDIYDVNRQKCVRMK